MLINTVTRPSRHLIGWFVTLILAQALLSFPPNENTADWAHVAKDGTAAKGTRVPMAGSLCAMNAMEKQIPVDVCFCALQ